MTESPESHTHYRHFPRQRLTLAARQAPDGKGWVVATAVVSQKGPDQWGRPQGRELTEARLDGYFTLAPVKLGEDSAITRNVTHLPEVGTTGTGRPRWHVVLEQLLADATVKADPASPVANKWTDTRIRALKRARAALADTYAKYQEAAAKGPAVAE